MLHQIAAMLSALWAGSKDKIQEHLVVLVGALWTLLLPIRGLVGALCVLVFADLITGMWKSIKRKKKITSRGWRATIGKLAIYFTALCSGFAMDRILDNDTPMIARAVALGIALTEIKSVFENFYAITGIDLIKSVMSKIKPPESHPDEFDKPEKKKPAPKDEQAE